MNQSLIAGRYRLDEALAEGGMATLYRAWDTSLRRPVAVKLLRQETTLSQAEREVFLRDARAIARFNHPSVMMVHDGGMVDGLPFLVMELLPGGSLRDRLKSGPLPVEEARKIAQGLASALEAAAVEGIRLPELRPEHILFDEVGRARLADLGIGEADSAIGESDSVATDVEPRSSVYLLGVLLYEMLTGVHPASTPAMEPGAPAPTTPAPPQLINPAVPETLGQVVLRALAPDPVERFASSAELGVALDSQAPAHPAPARARPLSPRRPARTPDPARSSRRTVMVALGALVCMALLLWGASTRMATHLLSETEQPAYPPPFGAELAGAEPDPSPAAPAAQTEADADEETGGEVAVTADGVFLPAVQQGPQPEPLPPPAGDAITVDESGYPPPPGTKPPPPPLGENDRIYTINIRTYSHFVATLRGLAQHVDYDLYLYDQEARELARSTAEGNAPEEIQLELPAGTYDLRVHHYAGPPNTRYNLRWRWTPASP
jgi:eukaryotic-like serine/threonine-protein kinase